MSVRVVEENRVRDPCIFRTVEIDFQIAQLDDGADKSIGREVKCQVLEFLLQARRAGHVVVGYGAPAKASTLLNCCGIGPGLLRFTVDLSPHKQGRFIPGVRIPILPPEQVFAARPDYLFILPWNIADEVMAQMAAVRAWGCRFVTAIPELLVV